MKIIYQFEPDPEKNDDGHDLKIFQQATKMYLAIADLDILRRNLYKGYKYYPSEDEMTEEEKNGDEEDKYSRINIDILLDDIIEIIRDSGYDEII